MCAVRVVVAAGWVLVRGCVVAGCACVVGQGAGHKAWGRALHLVCSHRWHRWVAVSGDTALFERLIIAIMKVFRVICAIRATGSS